MSPFCLKIPRYDFTILPSPTVKALVINLFMGLNTTKRGFILSLLSKLNGTIYLKTRICFLRPSSTRSILFIWLSHSQCVLISELNSCNCCWLNVKLVRAVPLITLPEDIMLCLLRSTSRFKWVYQRPLCKYFIALMNLSCFPRQKQLRRWRLKGCFSPPLSHAAL